MIKTTLKDLIGFVIKPDDRQNIGSLKSNLKIFLIAFSLFSTIIIVVVFPILILIDEMLELSHSLDVYLTLSEAMLLYVLLIPFIEELVFRYFLRYNGLKTMIISQKKWFKIFPILVYGSTICFGFLHLTNFSNTSNLFFFLSPLIVLSQLIGGIFISYIRVRLNFLWGVFYHCAWNFAAIVVLPYILYSFDNTYTEKTSNYNITIENVLFFNEEKHNFKIDSVAGKIISIEAKHFSIQKILDTLSLKNKLIVEDELINLSFKTKKGISKEAFEKILAKQFETKK
jgi:uncharacterized protein